MDVPHDGPEALRRLIEQTKMSGGIDPSLFHLARALTGLEDPEITCEACQAEIADFVDSEMIGEDAGALFPAVKRHLDLCPVCDEIYQDLLDVNWQLLSDALPRPAIPQPRLPSLQLSPTPLQLTPAPETWFNRLKPVIAGIRAVLVSFVNQGPLQPAYVLGATDFRSDGQMEWRQLVAAQLPQVPDGTLSITARRPVGAVLCTITVSLNSTSWDPTGRPVNLVLGLERRTGRTDGSGQVSFPDVPVAALPDIRIEIGGLG